VVALVSLASRSERSEKKPQLWFQQAKRKETKRSLREASETTEKKPQDESTRLLSKKPQRRRWEECKIVRYKKMSKII